MCIQILQIILLQKKLVGILTSFFIFGLWAVASQTFDKKNDWVAETAFYGFRDF